MKMDLKIIEVVTFLFWILIQKDLRTFQLNYSNDWVYI